MRLRSELLFLFLFLPFQLAGSDNLNLGGSIRSNLYVGLVYGDIYNYFNSNVITLKGETKPEENIQGKFEIRIRNENISNVKYLNDLKYREYIEPVSMQLYEGYIQFSSLFIKEMDLRVGKQRIAWGTADGFNPTDNFSPMDLEDPLDFKNKLSIWAITTDLYFSPFNISLVLQPVFEPALLPNFNLISGESNQMMGQYSDKLQEPVVVLPEFRAKNLIFGSRLGYKGEIFDLSFSYYHGYTGIPVVREVKIETGGFALKSLTPILSYVSNDIIGMDMAMNLFDIGIFGELAYVMPEGIEPIYYINSSKINNEDKRIFGIPENDISVEDSTFLKFAGGFDYTFEGGYYINVQYVRGFFNELSKSRLNNYIFAYMNKDFFDSKLQIQPSFGMEFDSDNDKLFGLDDTDNEKAYLFSLEVNYIPFNTGVITLGGAMVRGDDGSNLKMFERLDQIYLKFRLDF